MTSRSNVGGPLAVCLAAAVALASLAACKKHSSSNGDAGIDLPPPTTFIVFAPGAPHEPMPPGQVPFPSDLYLDATGMAQIGDLDIGNSAAPGFEDALRAAFAESDGFGLYTGIFLRVDGPVEPSTLAAGIHLIELDTGAEVPIETFYWAAKDLVAVIPAAGAQMWEAARYGYYVDSAARSPDGAPLGAQADFVAIRDATERPADPRLAHAYDAYQPLFAALRTAGVDLRTVAAGGVYWTQTIGAELAAIRDQIDAAPAPTPVVDAAEVYDGTELDVLCGVPVAELPGFDNPGGVAHANIDKVMHGTVTLPGYLAPTDRTQGIFQRDGVGDPIRRGDYAVRFTLAIPVGATLGDLPVAIYVHGIQNHRAKLFSAADTLAAEGIATIAIDLPFHGARNPIAVDVVNEVTGAPGPDGFGDKETTISVATFFGISAGAGLVPLDPRISRDSARQAMAEIIALTRVLEAGDWSGVASAAGLGQLVFRPGVMTVSQSIGSFWTTGVLAIDERIGAAHLSVPGGGFATHVLANSAYYGRQFLPIVASGAGLSADVSPDTQITKPNRFHPVLAVWQTVFERADPVAYAPLVVGDPIYRHDAPINLVQTQADQDELVPNQANELLLGAFGLPHCPLSAMTTTPRFGTFPSAGLPVTGNLDFPGGGVGSGCHLIFSPASHGLLTNQVATRRVEPDFPPFVDLAQEQTYDNPIVEFHDHLGAFAASYFGATGGVATISDPFAGP